MTDRRNFMKFFPAAGATAAISIAASPALAASNAPGFSICIASSQADQGVKDAANYVCSGTNDQNVINQAIDSIMNLGGMIFLSPGRYFCSRPIKIRTRVALVGSGRASILEAGNAWAGSAIIVNATADTHKIHISNLAIKGRYKPVGGIALNITSNAGFDERPDAANYITDVYIHGVGRHGVWLGGVHGRGNCLTRIRVLDAGRSGFVFKSADGFISQCEAGSSGGYGFVIQGSNNRFTNCKAWYSDESGFFIGAVRNQFAACEAQDNQKHGFYLYYGQSSLTSCHADSNSWNREAPEVKYAGFYIRRWQDQVQLIGCQAYDKEEGGRGRWQRFGFWLAGNNSFCQITGIGRNHASLQPLFVGNGSTNNSIEVLGN